MLVSDTPSNEDLSVAIIGMAGRLPGASTLNEYWVNLQAGNTSIHEFSRDELLAAGVGRALVDNPDAVFRHGVLSDINLFDPHFFGFTRRDAAMLNPQYRLMLECAYLALEDAGYLWGPMRDERPRVGVFVGSGRNHYERRLLGRLDHSDVATSAQIATGSDADFLSTTISYKLGLCGPSINVQTGCSSSLVAVHLACQSLLTGECDVAIAGGVSVRCLHAQGYVWQPGGILSRSGLCRPFSVDADGTVGGDGLGVVVLRRLADARAARDSIQAVLRGSAINNDGRQRVGFTAPCKAGQVEVIVDALRAAQVSPDAVTLVETHGTATAVGDAIEFAALQEVFGKRERTSAQCALTSVKANIGHLDAAAGIASLIKTVLSLQHCVIPAQPGFVSPNSNCDFAASPFYVPTVSTPWKGDADGRRYAGVSSFGIGGTNAHVILESAPTPMDVAPNAAPEIFIFSGKTDSAAARNFECFAATSDARFRQRAAYTLALRRPEYDWRTYSVSTPSLGDLQCAPPVRIWDGAEQARVCLLFPGMGSVTWEELNALLTLRGHFELAFNECLQVLSDIVGFNVRERLEHRTNSDEVLPFAGECLEQALHASVQYAMVRQLSAYGVGIRAVCGHSIGEYTAAMVAGVMSIADGMQLLVHRSRLCSRAGVGAMAVVACDPHFSVNEWVEKGLSVGAINSSDFITMSGPEPLIEALGIWATKSNVSFRRLPVKTAYHSLMLDPVVKLFEAHLATVCLSIPAFDFISTVTGSIESELLAHPQYWANHLREPVRFADAATTLLRSGGEQQIYLEIGPSAGLCKLLEVHPRWEDRWVTQETLNRRSGKNCEVQFLAALGRLWQVGYPINWNVLFGQTQPPAHLPGYSFDRIVCNVDQSSSATIEHPEEGSQLRLPAQSCSCAWPILPQDPRESVIDIVRGALGGENFDSACSFWSLGGTSLVGLQVIARIRKHLAKDVALSNLTEAGSIADFADLVNSGAIRSIKKSSQLHQESPSPDFQQIRPTIAPLSGLQRRLWFLDQYESGTEYYNVPLLKRLEGHLNLAILERSLLALCERHEVLRTRITTIDGEPMQIIEPTPSILFSQWKAAENTPRDAEATAWAYVREKALQPFKLESGPLWRCVVASISTGCHLILLSMHHIVTDGASMHILWRDLKIIYEALLEAKQPVLPILSVQYADFAASRVRIPPSSAAEEYWKNRLCMLPPLVSFGVHGDDTGCPQEVSFESLVEHLTPIVSDRLDATCRQLKISLFSAVATCVALGLYETVGSDDVVIGFPVSQRDSPELEELIGFFVNSLALRVRLRDAVDGGLCALLGKVHSDVQEGIVHADITYEQVVQLVQPQATPLGRPRNLFNVSLAMGVGLTAEVANDAHRFGQSQALPATLDVLMEQFDLGFFFDHIQTGLRLRLQFSRSFCSPTQARCLLAATVHALHRVADALPSKAKWLAVAEDSERFTFESPDTLSSQENL